MEGGGRAVVDVEVRWDDLDPLGHVNHAVAVTLIAEARLRWLSTDAAAAGYPDFAAAKIVASLTVDYRTPIEYGDPLTVAMTVARIGTKSYTLGYEATQDGELRFTASTVIVPRDVQAGGSRRVTDDERTYLSRFLSPARSCSATTC